MTAPSPTSAEGPTSAAAIAEWLQKEHGDNAATEQLEPVAAAVNRLVRRQHNPPPEGTEWGADYQLGATMLGARLHRRRKSVEGVLSQFSAEGAVYVRRHDDDVLMLLRLGPYAPPVVG